MRAPCFNFRLPPSGWSPPVWLSGWQSIERIELEDDETQLESSDPIDGIDWPTGRPAANHMSMQMSMQMSRWIGHQHPSGTGRWMRVSSAAFFQPLFIRQAHGVGLGCFDFDLLLICISGSSFAYLDAHVSLSRRIIWGIMWPPPPPLPPPSASSPTLTIKICLGPITQQQQQQQQQHHFWIPSICWVWLDWIQKNQLFIDLNIHWLDWRMRWIRWCIVSGPSTAADWIGLRPLNSIGLGLIGIGPFRDHFHWNGLGWIRNGLS